MQLLIFDCDGTLVDSLAGIGQVVNLAFARLGFAERFSMAQVSNVVGLSLEKALFQLAPHQTESEGLRLVTTYKEIYKELADAGHLGDTLYPGVRETLAHFHQLGLTLAVATGKSMRGARRTLEEHGIASFFSVVKSADCAPSKPHPGMILQILDETSIAPAHTLMIGDTDYDLIMGHQAGVRTCAVTYGCHERLRLAAAQPDFWIEQFDQLRALEEALSA